MPHCCICKELSRKWSELTKKHKTKYEVKKCFMNFLRKSKKRMKDFQRIVNHQVSTRGKCCTCNEKLDIKAVELILNFKGGG